VFRIAVALRQIRVQLTKIKIVHIFFGGGEEYLVEANLRISTKEIGYTALYRPI
jgi:hypothetical protein